jgi:PTH2 family peptidyl-tRNA hydrolase
MSRKRDNNDQNERPVKQVIVVREDLNMRKGKMSAQVAHASLAAFTRKMQINEEQGTGTVGLKKPAIQWLRDGFTKIVVGVPTEEDLLALIARAEELGVPCQPITDSGRTEFNGVPTLTCAAFGPDYVDNVDKVTLGLKLM